MGAVTIEERLAKIQKILKENNFKFSTYDEAKKFRDSQELKENTVKIFQ